MSKPRKLTHRQIVKAVRDFDLEGKLEQLFAELGPLVWRKGDHTGGGKREIAICTRVGMLQVSLHRMHDPQTLAPLAGTVTGIYCAFDEPERAVEVFGSVIAGTGYVNPYSGKWNHASYVETAGLTDPEQVKSRLRVCALDSFRYEIERVTIPLTGEQYR